MGSCSQKVIMKDFSKTINLKEEKIVSHGVNVDFYRPKKIEEIYGRKNIGLKVFSRKTTNKIVLTSSDEEKIIPENLSWTKNIMREIAICQNVGSFHGLAGRVYDIVSLEEDLVGLVVELLEDHKRGPCPDIQEELNELGIAYSKGESLDAKNFVDGKTMDANCWRMGNLKKYEKSILKKIQNTQNIGEGGYQCYQTFDGVVGKRDTQYRVEMLELDKDNFKGKTVLDIGCSIGAFCHEATRR